MIVGSKELIKSKNLRDEHLMLFELETNKDELKSGLIRVEGRKNFLENEIKMLLKDKSRA